MDVPQKIKERVLELLRQEEGNRVKSKKIQRTRGKRLKKINELRRARKEELGQASEIVADWVLRLHLSVILRDIRKVRPVLEIFSAKFWLGEPSPEDAQARAVINLHADGKVEYCEQRNTSHGQSRYPQTLTDNLNSSAFREFCNNLIRILHPLYLLQFAEAIGTGKVWDCIERSLR